MYIKDGIVYNAEGVRVGKLVDDVFKPNGEYDAARDGELIIPEKPPKLDEQVADGSTEA